MIQVLREKEGNQFKKRKIVGETHHEPLSAVSTTVRKERICSTDDVFRKRLRVI